MAVHRGRATRGATWSDADVLVHRIRLAVTDPARRVAGVGAASLVGGLMSDARRPKSQGEHPSGALICQRCGSAATLRAAYGGDWARRRRTSALFCGQCIVIVWAQAERFHLTVVTEPI